MSQKVPGLRRVVQNFTQLFGVRIEPCCLLKYPVANTATININSAGISSLTLIGLPQSDAHKVLPFFPQIKRFGMQNMQISNHMEEFPADITELTLIDCNIDVGPMEKWMNAFKTTLRRLHMDNVETFYAFDNSVRVFSISKLKDLNSFTFKNQLHTIKLNTHELEFLTIISAGLTCKFGSKLRHLYCDASQVSFSGGMEQLTKLEFVTLKNWKTSLIEKCRALPSLKELEILSTVDGKHKAKIDAMPMNVLVNYCHVMEPPEEPNLIFEMLNYDCLLEIVNYLSTMEWMSFGRLHENAEMVVATYKYPREEVCSWEIIDSGMYADDQDHFLRISKLVQTLWIARKVDQSFTDWDHFLGAFEYLSTAKLGCLSEDQLESLPCELDKLILYDDPRSVEYVQRLKPTLRSLHISEYADLAQYDSDSDRWQCLTELEDLQELKIGVSMHPDIVSMLLKRSLDSLECLKIAFDLDREGWEEHEQVLSVMSSLRNLKELHIEAKFGWRRFFCDGNRLYELFTSVGPKLEKLDLTRGFDPEVYEQMLYGYCLKDLPHLKINGGDAWNFAEIATALDLMTNLRKLEIHQEGPLGVMKGKDQREFMKLLEVLPSLTELSAPFFLTTFKFEMKIRSYLMENNRTLRINSGELRPFLIPL